MNNTLNVIFIGNLRLKVLKRTLHALAGAQSFPSSAIQAFEISATPCRMYGRRTLASARARNAV